MRNSISKIGVISMLLAVLFCSIAFAKTDDGAEIANSSVSEEAMFVEEGEIFSSLLASVSNIGDGGIGVHVEALMYQDVPWIELTITLQRYEQRGSSFGWYDVDPDPIVETYYNTSEGVYDDILYGYPTGYSYRAKVVMKIDSVTKTTTTKGVRITGP